MGANVNPSTTTTVITTNSAKAAISVPLTTNMPTTPNKLDILLLVDVSKSITTTMLTYLLSPYSKTFFANVRSLTLNSYFGVASFTDQALGTGCSSSDYAFRLHSPLSGDQVNILPSLSCTSIILLHMLIFIQNDFESAITNYFKQTALGCDDTVSKNDAQLDALYGATSASVGWRSDAFRVVILVTDSPFWEGAGYASGSLYANRSDVLNVLINANIVPLILPTSAVLSVYTSLITSFNNIGAASVVSSDFSNVYTVAASQLSTLFKALSTVVVQDQYGFVSSVSAKQTVTTPVNASSAVAIKFPQAYINQTFSTYPIVVVTMMGWGTANIIAQGKFLSIIYMYIYVNILFNPARKLTFY